MESVTPTREDIRTGAVFEALQSCYADAAGKDRPHRGAIRCPCCGGTLDYLAKSTAPGTIWGTCRTRDCISWAV